MTRPPPPTTLPRVHKVCESIFHLDLYEKTWGIFSIRYNCKFTEKETFMI